MKNAKVLVILSAIVLLVVGSIVYYTWPSLRDESEKPPVLSIGGSNLQGMLKNSKNFFEFTDEEVANAPECEDGTVKIAEGTHFYYVTKQTSLKKLIGMMYPTESNRLLFAFYSPGESTPGLDKGFHVYPEGGKENNTIADIANFKILPYRGFVLHALEESKFCDAADLVKTENQAADKIKLIKNNEEGWTAIPVFNNVANLTAALQDYQGRIKTIWFQKGENSFEKADLNSLELFDGYYMMWIKLKVAESVS